MGLSWGLISGGWGWGALIGGEIRYNFNSSTLFVIDGSDFLAARTEQPFSMRRLAQICLRSPE